MQKDTRDQIVGLRRAVIEYHSAVVGQGLIISELEERVRRLEQHSVCPVLGQSTAAARPTNRGCSRREMSDRPRGRAPFRCSCARRAASASFYKILTPQGGLPSRFLMRA